MTKNAAAKSGSKTAKKTKSSSQNHSTKSRKTNVAELRDDLRIPIQLLVDYKSQGNYLFDFCKDIGTGGVFIQTTNPLPKGSKIELTFTIPDSKETVKTAGEVIWVQEQVPGQAQFGFGMGVQFFEFCETQKRTLQEFVSRYHGDRFNKKLEKKPA